MMFGHARGGTAERRPPAASSSVGLRAHRAEDPRGIGRGQLIPRLRDRPDGSPAAARVFGFRPAAVIRAPDLHRPIRQRAGWTRAIRTGRKR